MARFQFRARDRQSVEQSGLREANDRFELARFLRAEGLLLLEAHEIGAAPGAQMPGGLKKNVSIDLNTYIRRVTLADKIVFSKNLGVMIGAGLPLTRALDALSRESHNPKFKVAILAIEDQIRQGKTFAESLSKHPKIFPSLYIAMVDAGEKSGKLKESLSILASQMQADYDLVRKVRGAMMYPSIILAAMILIGALMIVYVVPTLSAVFKELNVELPASTQFIIDFSDFFINHFILVILGTAGFIFGIIAFFRTTVGKHLADNVVIRLPVIGPLAKKFNAARASRTLSSLLSAGVQVMEALEITARVVQNHLYSHTLSDAKKSIQKGETISKVFLANEHLYPSLVGEMLSVGEETGESSKMLGEVASFYEQQVSEATKDLSTIIEPVLMLIIGAVVGFFAVSMITPMYSLVGAI
ncbi:MAG: type II secretion system F family protein [Candidatus Ryanbacteria bacterium]|nr:type II secretion system F family protein [Candidatus Ryanbacteria bacterium]